MPGSVRGIVRVGMILGAFFASLEALAEREPVQASACVETRGVQYWYGWQGVIADAASIGVFLGGWASHDGNIVGAGWGMWLLGTPTTHFAHLNPLGLASVGIRFFAPFLGLAYDAAAGFW